MTTENDDYHSDTSTISRSMLSVFCDSPLDYYHQFITGLMPRKVPSKPMLLGTICHAVLLEKKLVSEVAVAYPADCLKKDGSSINPAPARVFEQSVGSLIAVKEEVIEQAEKICEAARNSILGPVLELDVQFEQRVDAVIVGVAARCKPDIHSETFKPQRGLVVDLKFGQVKPADFQRSAKRFRYIVQHSYYTDILETKYGKPFDFWFFAIEPTFPYRVARYIYDERSVEIAREYHRKKLLELKSCLETGVWRDDFPETLTVGPWDLEQSEETDKVDWSEE